MSICDWSKVAGCFDLEKMAADKCWLCIILLLVSCVVSSEIALPCDYTGDIKINYFPFKSELVIPFDLRDESLSMTTVNHIIKAQVTPICQNFLLDVCSADIIKLVHIELEQACPCSSYLSQIMDGVGLDDLTAGISFEGADHRLPKVLPCDWSGSISVNIHNIRVDIPVAIAINGDVGAPVKSFAQIYSFLRPSLVEACESLIVTAPEYSTQTNIKLHTECMLSITSAFEDEILSNCPIIEKSFEQSMPFVEFGDGQNVILHVRSLAGDEVEHFWHIMLAELLPSLSIVLQFFDSLDAYDIDLDAFLSHRKVVVVVHNSLRPWGESPLHKFYDQLTAASDGVISFIGSSLDRPGFRLPRWDYECNENDLVKLREAAMFLQRILLPELASVGRNHVVVQERSHNKKLGSFYEQYFCDLIEKGELPYLDKTSCGVYGSRRRRVNGLADLADEWRGMYQSKGVEVVLTSPDSDWTLAQQIEPYVGASAMVLGHGGGMVYALFLRPNATVVEVTSPAKHNERNGAAKGLFTIGRAVGLKVRRVVCSEDSAMVVDLLHETGDIEPIEGLEFTGDVSDGSTECGKQVQRVVDGALNS